MLISFWARIRQARLVSVLAFYLGASWLLLQVTELLEDALQLPPWILPVSVLLLLIGLLVVVATAWVQTRPVGVGEEEVPRGWQIAFGDLRRSVAAARFPHLTWGRAILGGVVAFSLLFGLAGLSVLLRDRRPAEALRPAEAHAAAAPGIAVFPFRVVGPGSELWQEGLVDLFSTNLEGAGPLRKIDPRAVLAAWRRTNAARSDVEVRRSLAVARELGARYALTGTMVGSESEVRLTAELYDARTGEMMRAILTDGSPDSVLVLVDRVALALLREELLPSATGLDEADLARLTTSSLSALKAYLAGEQLYRRSRWREAAEAFERAVDADSAFALAWYRLAVAKSNLYLPATELRALAERAARLAERLPERERLLLDAYEQRWQGRPEAIHTFERFTARYPDDVEGWAQLGKAVLFLGGPLLISPQRGFDALRRAIDLNPFYGPPYSPLIFDGLLRQDTGAVRSLLAGYRRIDSESNPCLGAFLASRLAWGGDADRADAFAALDTLGVEPFT